MLSRAFVTAIRSSGDSRATGQELYKQIIKPVLSPDVASLIIVPDGPLHLIPFSALVNEGGGYLSSDLTLSAAPSATVYYTLNRTPNRVSRPQAVPGCCVQSARPVGPDAAPLPLAAYRICAREVLNPCALHTKKSPRRLRFSVPRA